MLDTSLLREAILNANEKFIEKYGRQDSGTCGFAHVAIYFGRKRKLKNQLIDAGIISSYPLSDWAGTYYSVHANSFLSKEDMATLCPTQNIDFYEDIHEALAEALIEQLPKDYENIVVRSRMD